MNWFIIIYIIRRGNFIFLTLVRILACEPHRLNRAVAPPAKQWAGWLIFKWLLFVLFLVPRVHVRPAVSRFWRGAHQEGWRVGGGGGGGVGAGAFLWCLIYIYQRNDFPQIKSCSLLPLAAGTSCWFPVLKDSQRLRPEQWARPGWRRCHVWKFWALLFDRRSNPAITCLQYLRHRPEPTQSCQLNWCKRWNNRWAPFELNKKVRDERSFLFSCKCIQPRIGCDEDPGGCLPPVSARRRVCAPDKRPLSSLLRTCWVSHSRCPLIKLQPCSLLSCWQTKVLKRTPSVIASNLSHNVLFHVKWPEKKGSACSLHPPTRCDRHTFTFF